MQSLQLLAPSVHCFVCHEIKLSKMGFTFPGPVWGKLLSHMHI